VVDRSPHNTQRLKVDTLNKIQNNRKLVNLYNDDKRIDNESYLRYSEVQSSFPEWYWDSVKNVFIDKDYSNACL
jgi:hypothetical protein